MRRFACTCGQPLFFPNSRCLNCGADVGFDPDAVRLGPIEATPSGAWRFREDERQPAPEFRFCEGRMTPAVCNWLLLAGDPGRYCLSCSTTRAIPDLSRPRNAHRLRELETAKRRTLFNLQTLGLPITPRSVDPETGLAFDFLETLEGAPTVMTGHLSGVVTLNVAEADDDYRERNRDSFKEPYRTLVGHMRHELGHYYWDLLVRDSEWLEPFRALFGDERTDYCEALDRHYGVGPPPYWNHHFISGYASSHPWEDWAETWAHYLHIRSTLETIASYRLDTSAVELKVTPFGQESLHTQDAGASGSAFLGWINAWVVLTTVMNETARSMGQPDIYPFVMNGPVVTKLHFVHRVITRDDPAAIGQVPSQLFVPG